MKEVKLKNGSYLRSDSAKVEVDENEINFVNGVALVKGTLSVENRWDKESYDCYGLINEQFEEVYDGKLEGRISRYLMFLGYNKNAVRIDEENYLVAVDTEDDISSWTKYCHLRVIDGIPIMMNILKNVQLTNIPHLITDGHALYNIQQAKFITRRYSSIKALPLDETNTQTYIVEDIVTSYNYPDGDSRNIPYNKDTGIVDNLMFVLDEKDRVISPIYSQLTCNYWNASPILDTDYNKLWNQRRSELEEMEQRGKEIVEGIQLAKYRFLKPSCKD